MYLLRRYTALFLAVHTVLDGISPQSGETKKTVIKGGRHLPGSRYFFRRTCRRKKCDLIFLSASKGFFPSLEKLFGQTETPPAFTGRGRFLLTSQQIQRGSIPSAGSRFTAGFRLGRILGRSSARVFFSGRVGGAVVRGAVSGLTGIGSRAVGTGRAVTGRFVRRRAGRFTRRLVRGFIGSGVRRFIRRSRAGRSARRCTAGRRRRIVRVIAAAGQSQRTCGYRCQQRNRP